jgi:hypothetical protein
MEDKIGLVFLCPINDLLQPLFPFTIKNARIIMKIRKT